MFKPTKLGRVTFVGTGIDTSKGALIEDLSDRESPEKEKKSPSPPLKVFVPGELLRNFMLKEGQLVEFEEENNVATVIRPLSKSSS